MALKGLGRGLDALLGDFDATANAASNSVQEVAIAKLYPNPKQPRKDFDQDRLQELSGSIRQHGMVQPIVVRPDGERYMIVTGERRYRAAKLAGLKLVPVMVREYEDEQLHEIALIENIQRENLNPVEEAAAISFLMRQHDLTQEEVAERLSKSRPAVTNTLRLLQLPEPVKAYLRSGALSAGHGRALAALDDTQLQERLAAQAAESGCSVRALEQIVKAAAGAKPDLPEKTKARTDAPKLPADLFDFEEKLREKLSTKVKIQGGEKRGKIMIEYYSKEELDALYALLLGE